MSIIDRGMNELSTAKTKEAINSTRRQFAGKVGTWSVRPARLGRLHVLRTRYTLRNPTSATALAKDVWVCGSASACASDFKNSDCEQQAVSILPAALRKAGKREKN